MKFKEWLLELYGTSAWGEVEPDDVPMGPGNDTRNYASKGIGRLRTMSDQKKKRGSGLGSLPVLSPPKRSIQPL